MRTASSLIVLAAVVFGAFTLAGADSDTPDPEKMEKQIEALQMQVKYLRGREDVLTTYLLKNEERAAAIEEMNRMLRIEGWENRKTTVPAKILMLKGFDGLAASMRKDLPQLSKEDQVLRKRILVYRKTHKLAD